MGGYEIYTVNPDGSDLGPLSEDSPAGGFLPSWTADGTAIAYGGDDIYRANADGTGQQQLTGTDPNEYRSDFSPTWSPDGSQIAFAAMYRTGDRGIFVMNADGSEEHALDIGQQRLGSETVPSWSPSGDKLVYAVYPTSGSEIYTFDLASSEEVHLTDDFAAGADGPDWSPDGTKIVFQAHEANGDMNIYSMNADGSDPQPLTDDTATFNGYPTWSPDGTKIAWTRSSGIHVMDADGSNEHNITSELPESVYTSDWQPNTAPAVTPLRPKPGSSTKDRTPRVLAGATDVQSDLAKGDLTLSVDGRAVAQRNFAYDQTTDRLSYTPAKALSYGRHKVQVVATDSVNLSTTKGWSFKVAR